MWLLLREPDARAIPLYALLADEIEDEVRRTGVPVLAIDGIGEAVAALEQVFREPLAAGPRAGSLRERRALLREANLAHVDQVRSFYARPWATGDSEAVERTFLCECGDRECVDDVRCTVADAASGPLLAPGH